MRDSTLLLPDETLVNILDRLENAGTRNSAALVCRRWWQLDRETRRRIDINVPPGGLDPDELVHALVCTFTGLRSVILHGTTIRGPPRRWSAWHKDGCSSSKRQRLGGFVSFTDKTLQFIGLHCVQLEELRLDFCSLLTSAGLEILAQSCRGLKLLSIHGCYIGLEGLMAVGKFCKLEELSLFESVTDSGLVAIAIGCASSLRSLSLNSTNLANYTLEAIGANCIHLKKLHIGTSNLEMEGVVALLKGCPNLEEVCLESEDLTDDVLLAINSSCLSLSLQGMPCMDRGLLAIGRKCINLTKLELAASDPCFSLSYESLETVARGCQNLETLRIRNSLLDAGLRPIGVHCRQLKILHLSHCSTLTDENLSEIGNGCLELEQLILRRCSLISDESICSISKGCKNLKELQIRESHKVGNAGLEAIGRYCKKLITFTITNAENIDDVGMKAISGCTCLRYFTMTESLRTGGDGLAEVAHGCPDLIHVDVTACCQVGDKDIVALAKECSKLQFLNITRCKNVTSRGIIALARRCRYLRGIYMAMSSIGNPALEALVKYCPKLEICHVNGCQNVTETGITTIVASCFVLRDLMVDPNKATPRTRRQAEHIINDGIQNSFEMDLRHNISDLPV